LYLAFHIAAFCSRAAFGAPGQSSAEAREHAQRGLTFAKLNDLKGAESEFRRAVELSPRPQVRFTGFPHFVVEQ
jgi:hypothetical protein